MNATTQSLYDRICQFSFDEGHEDLSFSDRLARENGWTPAYAARVIEEYKRFAFLAVASGHPVTPSDQVDQAWHLHLTYTKSYWKMFCGQILGKPLHHGPTRGGAEEASKFDRWYRRTLECYARFYGHEAPNDIWPDPSVRFGRDLNFQRVNTRQNWVIRKPHFFGFQKSVSAGAILILIIALSVFVIESLLKVNNHWEVLGRPGEPSATEVWSNNVVREDRVDGRSNGLKKFAVGL